MIDGKGGGGGGGQGRYRRTSIAGVPQSRPIWRNLKNKMSNARFDPLSPIAARNYLVHGASASQRLVELAFQLCGVVVVGGGVS